MTGELLVVCGSRRSPSRTRALTEYAAGCARDADLDVETLDLREQPMELFDGRDPAAYDAPTREAVEAFLDAELYVIASPVYFGGISGALKNLIDHIPYEEFQETSRTAGLVMTGRDKRHKHILDAQLRSTMVYLGVDVPTTSVFATEEDFDDFTLANPSIETRLEELIEETRSLHEKIAP